MVCRFLPASSCPGLQENAKMHWLIVPLCGAQRVLGPYGLGGVTTLVVVLTPFIAIHVCVSESERERENSL